MSKLFTFFWHILGEAAVDEIFRSIFTFKLSLILGFQHGICSSVEAIVPLLATLPLAIGLNFFWFLTALLFYPKSAILGLSFLDPEDLCLANQFSRGSWKKLSVSTYLT